MVGRWEAQAAMAAATGAWVGAFVSHNLHRGKASPCSGLIHESNLLQGNERGTA